MTHIQFTHNYNNISTDQGFQYKKHAKQPSQPLRVVRVNLNKPSWQHARIVELVSPDPA